MGEDDNGWYSNDGSPSTPTTFNLPAMTSAESRDHRDVRSKKPSRKATQNQNQSVTHGQRNLEQRLHVFHEIFLHFYGRIEIFLKSEFSISVQ